MTLHPKGPTDLMLAPVAAEIDGNLQRIRDKADDPEILDQLALELNVAKVGATRDERAAQVLAFALRNVDLHGWTAEVTADCTRISLSGGSVSLDIGLSASLQRYIVSGSETTYLFRERAARRGVPTPASSS